MTQIVEQLQQGVSNVAEVFSEIEDELDPSVYRMLQPAIAEAQTQLNRVAGQFNNLSKIQQLLSLINKHPEIHLDGHVFDILISRFEDQIPEEDPIPAVEGFVEAVAPVTAAFPDPWLRFREERGDRLQMLQPFNNRR